MKLRRLICVDICLDSEGTFSQYVENISKMHNGTEELNKINI